jgi:hypothetical protein
MADRIIEDEDHLVITVDLGVGDEVMFVKCKNGELAIEIDEPWAGSTETGFGATTSINLTPFQVEVLKRWLVK